MQIRHRGTDSTHASFRTSMCAYVGIIIASIVAGLSPAELAHAQEATGQEAVPDAQQSVIDRQHVFDIPAGPLNGALTRFSEQSGIQLMFEPQVVQGATVPGFEGTATAAEALDALLTAAGVTWTRVNGNTVALQGNGNMRGAGNSPVPAVAQNGIGNGVTDGAGALGNGDEGITQPVPGVEEVIVTGQKREERIQDVPIAISAFSAEDLEAQKLEGGFDLLKAIPNVTFSKTNFTSYNFQIRGVGTQAISATTDPGVAVAFNNSAIIQNRLFEQEYLDVERVEVLRGPQGTLYGRNATAGVINVISNKPELGVCDGMIDVEVGNYNTRRLQGMFNMPIGDTLAIRGAYASTDRDGYTFNAGTGNRVDGRDLWTGRLSVAWQPNDRLHADLIYERFEEFDDRLRTGKQLCHRQDGPQFVGDADVADRASPLVGPHVRRALFGQGCKPGSLYSDDAFGTPNGLSYNFVLGLLGLRSFYTGIGWDADRRLQTLIQDKDPYGGKMQSRNLREIESILDPHYRAEADLFELNLDFDITDSVTFSSQTAYVKDETYSFQDFNRFNTEPIFTDTSTLFAGQNTTEPTVYRELAPRPEGTPPGTPGVFCDPQLGCSNTLAGFDIAQASAEQFSQEFRLQSSFAGPLNFSLGANYTEFESLVDYYIMFNLTTAMAMIGPFNFEGEAALADPPQCFASDWGVDLFTPPVPVPLGHPDSICPYIDPNPVNHSENFEGDGHNYYRSKNPYELESWASFGELYWNINDALKLTAGLRYTDDRKTFIPVPTQVLLAPSIVGGGTVAKGYPEKPAIEQNWGEWTGRIVLDWQPVLDFTEETLVYASFSRGYKGGGANPPQPGFASLEENVEQVENSAGAGVVPIDALLQLGLLPVLELTAVEYEPTFEPEFVNAYEIGTKNTLFGGAMTLNATAFYYDYADYQVSQIRDRTAVNENFDAEMWGLELETIFVPSPNWQFLANIGYLKTKIAEGETSIDIMNRTQGNRDYTLAKPWAQLPSNCVLPTHVAEWWVENRFNLDSFWKLCGGVGGLLENISAPLIDPEFGTGNQPYDVSNYPELNGGAGLAADLGGNELPQSPNLTVTLGGQYSFDLTPEWRGTVRLDYYWQDESYHRVYNTEPYDRLKSWSNTNLSFWVNNPVSGITVEAYVKNLFNETPITGAFLNSDDTGLTTNVFMLDPRLIGVSIRKEF